MTENISHYPLHWTSKPLGVISSLRSETGYPKEELLSVYLDRGVVLFSDVDEKRTNATSSDLSGYQLVEVGDFVLNNQQAWRGSVGVSFYRGIVSPAYLVLRLSDELHPNFANYMFRNRDMVGHFVICSKGVGTIQRNLYWPQVKRMPVVYPDLPEQKAISNLLDQKTTQIDKTIRVKEQQITLLKERKQILIQNAVTRGLNPETPMRDSKFEWIGEIPAHWDVMANRALFAERVEPGREGLPLLSVSIHSGVSEEEVSEEENVRGRVKIADKTKYNLVRPGDIAFNMMRAWQGAIGEVRTEGMISPAYTIAMPSQKIVPKFFEYQYRTPIFIQQMDRNSKGITDFRKRLYWDGFKQLITLVPPIEEQGAIVEYIDREVAKQDRAVSLLDQQITKLKEYKATMINSAVTGKIKVPGVVEPVQGMNEPEAREVCQ